MPQAPRLSRDLRSMARQRIRDGRLPVKFSLVSKARGRDVRRSCNLCGQLIECNGMRYEEADLRDGRSLTFHISCHVAWQLECLRWSTEFRH